MTKKEVPITFFSEFFLDINIIGFWSQTVNFLDISEFLDIVYISLYIQNHKYIFFSTAILKPQPIICTIKPDARTKPHLKRCKTVAWGPFKTSQSKWSDRHVFMMLANGQGGQRWQQGAIRNMETVFIIYKNTNFTCWRFMSGRQVYLYAREGLKW